MATSRSLESPIAGLFARNDDRVPIPCLPLDPDDVGGLRFRAIAVKLYAGPPKQ